MVKPIPDAYPRVTPYLIVQNASDAIEFYSSVLGAKERVRLPAPGDRIGHAELELGNSILMLADESPEMDARAPGSVGGTPVSLHVYVEDCDSTFQRAIEAGARELRAVEDRFYGDRSGAFEDPFGHRWDVATHVEDVSMEELSKRMAETTAGA
jgi:PhnB protein